MNLNKINWKQLGINAGIPHDNPDCANIPAILWLMGGLWRYVVFQFPGICDSFCKLGVVHRNNRLYFTSDSCILWDWLLCRGNILSCHRNHSTSIVIVVVAGAVSFILAFIVGAITLRLRGIYFAMFTFGLVLLVQQVVNYWLISIQGLRGIVVATESNGTIYYYLLGIFVVTMMVAYLIRKSKCGISAAKHR